MCVVCVQTLAYSQQWLLDPFLPEMGREDAESEVQKWQGHLQQDKAQLAEVEAFLAIQAASLSNKQGEPSGDY